MIHIQVVVGANVDDSSTDLCIPSATSVYVTVDVAALLLFLVRRLVASVVST